MQPKCSFVSTFSSQKARFEKSQCPKPVWLRPKCNFLEKVAFRVCEEKAQDGKGAQSSILEKARACLFISVGLTRQLPNYPLINQTISFTPFLIPLISLLWPLPSQ